MGHSKEFRQGYCQAQVQVQDPGQVHVMSRSCPRSGPKGPRTQDLRPGPGLYTKFGLPLIQDDIQDDIQDNTQDDIYVMGFQRVVLRGL